MPRLPQPPRSRPPGPATGSTGAAGDPRQALARAKAHHVAGRLREAYALYQQVLAVQPKTAPALLGLGDLALRAGQPAAAIDLLAQATQADPKDPQAPLMLGQARLAGNDLAGSRSALEEALRRRPRLPEAHLLLGLIHQRQGALPAAAEAFRKAIKARKDFADAHLNLGSALMMLDQPAEALTHLRRAATLSPKSPLALLNLGQALLAQSQPADALKTFDRALEVAPDMVPALMGRARAFDALHAYPQARAAYEACVAAAPQDAAVLNDAGGFLMADNDCDAAAEMFRRALAAPGASDPMRLNLVRALITGDRIDDALEAIAALIADFPDWAEVHRLKGDALVRRGAFAEARAAYELAWSLAPEDLSIPAAIAYTGKLSADDPLPGRLSALDEAALEPADRIDLHYTLGKACDDRGDPDGAFAHYAVANTLAGASLPFDAPAHTALIDRIMAVFSADFFAERGESLGTPEETPVLVVGLPRSGTSLVEQIIASHPDAAGAGELTHLARLERALPWIAGSADGGTAWPEAARLLTPGQLDDTCTRYLAHLTRVAPDSKRVVDKLPNNFLRLGLFALAFPRGRVVHCVRDPLDSCLSIYFQNFTAAHPFSHRLEDLGAYARDYLRLMDHWRQVLPCRFLDLDYAALLDDQDGVSRSLIDFLDLSWDPAVLTFATTERSVATASKWQVRQGLSRSSLGRWHRYEAHLAPLIQALG